MNRSLGILLSFALLALPLRAAEYHVNQAHAEASDSQSGTPEKPWKTLARAAAVEPGDTVWIHAGVYRETLAPAKSGTAEKPIAYRAAPGGRVTLNGSDRLEGWARCTADELKGNPHADKIFRVELPYVPETLYEGTRELALARTPDTGWWAITQGLSLTEFTDAVHLVQDDPRAWDGWLVCIREDAGGALLKIPPAAFDPRAHKLTLAEPYSKYREKIDEKRDRYFMANHITALDGPGQYVLQKQGAGSRLFVWPSAPDARGLPVVDVPRRAAVVNLTERSFVILDGLELAFGSAQGVETDRDAAHEGLVVWNCWIHHNAGYGIRLRSSRNALFESNVIQHNSHGIVLYKSHGGNIARNDIGFNRVDGIVAAGNIRALRIARNFVHDHVRMGHPDNIQFWDDVSGVTIDSNVLWNGGQTIMSSGLKDSAVTNNLLVGSHAVALILNKSERMTVRHNTIVATGLSPTDIGSREVAFEGNLVAPLQSFPLYGVAEGASFACDYNLLWTLPGDRRCLAIVGKDWTATTLEALRAKGLEAHGVHAAPRFRGAPAYYVVTHYGRVAECTASKLITLGKLDGRIKPGDTVELNFDGVAREVTGAGEDWLEFKPPLPEAPSDSLSIAHWGANKDIRWDLGLAEDSPARKAGPGGKDIGCDLDLAAFRRGDFDQDGARDLPDWNVEGR
ncbi:MAG: right-handed parallel beta-helix repeat-containing protein [Planctomycetota bacterium]|nr:right-handed parallel beta-helix repeat-containing protein [Planctomycetota bacterium]